MKFSFKAKIYKVGINPCVKVPSSISGQMKASKGYIPVKGHIERQPFRQTLVPVKGEGYRLYVNGPMLKGAQLTVGQSAHFTIEQDFTPRHKAYPMHKALKKRLDETNLFDTFKQLTPSQQKEVNRYLHQLKTEETLNRNIDNVIKELKKKAADAAVKFPRSWPFKSK